MGTYDQRIEAIASFLLPRPDHPNQSK